MSMIKYLLNSDNNNETSDRVLAEALAIAEAYLQGRDPSTPNTCRLAMLVAMEAISRVPIEERAHAIACMNEMAKDCLKMIATHALQEEVETLIARAGERNQGEVH